MSKIKKPNSPQSKGGITQGIIARKNAIDKYYENPNVCGFCNKIIEIKEKEKVREVKRKKFCNQSCAAKINNEEYHKRKKLRRIVFKFICTRNKSKNNEIVKILKERIKKLIKEKLVIVIKIRRNEKFHYLSGTKKELFDKYKSWQGARGKIQQHARYIYNNSNNPKKCINCGYDNHYEVCHKKAVSEFDDNANIINEINNIDNLMALCPNHHWEFDNKMKKIN